MGFVVDLLADFEDVQDAPNRFISVGLEVVAPCSQTDVFPLVDIIGQAVVDVEAELRWHGEKEWCSRLACLSDGLQCHGCGGAEVR